MYFIGNYHKTKGPKARSIVDRLSCKNFP